MLTPKTTYLAMLPFLILCACAKPNTAAPVAMQNTLSLTQLTNKTWQVEDINQRGIIDNAHVTLMFGDDNRISGKSGCNNYSGSYTLTGNKLAVIPPMISTRMMCPPALMQLENEYIAILSTAEKVELSAMGALIMTSQNGKTITFMTNDAVKAEVEK
ncbi:MULTISPECIES: META domain-containing protein [Methylotenera]|uniref:META domain-containing protein n=1 Tax=Methylotenera TaxID=359407 RepID=UPI00039D1E2B|nr:MULTISPECIES: META domain-containing protein [Methylotenera]